MICQFKRLIYPKAVTAGDASYMIALYRPCEKVMDAAGNVVSEIKAVGYCLPTADNLRYDMRGRWSRSAKHGIQFEVEGFDEVIVPSHLLPVLRADQGYRSQNRRKDLCHVRAEHADRAGS